MLTRQEAGAVVGLTAVYWAAWIILLGAGPATGQIPVVTTPTLTDSVVTYEDPDLPFAEQRQITISNLLAAGSSGIQVLAPGFSANTGRLRFGGSVTVGTDPLDTSITNVTITTAAGDITAVQHGFERRAGWWCAARVRKPRVRAGRASSAGRRRGGRPVRRPDRQE